MEFNYEETIWGRGTAELKLSSPTYFRLKKSLKAISAIRTGKVLEVGCGAGQFIRAIKKIRPELECFGCDISASAIEEAKKVGDGVSYDASGARLPYEDSCFDAILVYDVLEHLENPGQFLLEISRVLKIKGIFYCFVPCEGDLFSLWNFLDKLGLKKGLTKKYAGHIQYFSRKELARLFYEAGFKAKRFIYSEHLVGQLAGVAAFYLMNKNSGQGQINNEKFFANKKNLLFNAARIVINTAINLESLLFSRVPSPNVHAVLIKGNIWSSEADGV